MDYRLEGQADCCNRLMDPLGRLSFQEPFFKKINFMLALLSLRRKGQFFFLFFIFDWWLMLLS